MACISDARVILEDQVLGEGWVSFESGAITGIGQGNPIPTDENLDAQNLFLAPGFIDLHIHGGYGFDFLEATAEGFAAAATFHLTGGTTSLCPTAATSTYERFETVISHWQQAQTLTRSRLLPLHLEGPHLAPGKAGAQDPMLMRPPTKADIQWVLTRSSGISQITIAPELPGALEFISAASAAGIRMSAGHTEASGEEMQKAVEAGLTKVTHLFNAMSSATKKGMFRQPGVLEYALADDNLFCELVSDGFHVVPTLTRMAYNAKGPDRIMLITDALAGAGMPLGYRFHLGRLDCKVGEGFGMLADESALAGSLARTIDLVRFMVESVGLPLVEAVRMASLTPARALGRESLAGSIAKAKNADFVLFDDQFKVHGVWVGGERAWSV
ncbi:MAG: N-acetylglucosamine-6-phosphate deacetylase [Verrucomicrobia bacterium]|nr:N-acetylglucosamine-6-phosphate deacetylase [Verrucomicrobiota bacterium]MBV8279841.1 N-acetylglucosamine-6-phosphate deacetylase [Verrucomicrobiota bacterium]